MDVFCLRTMSSARLETIHYRDRNIVYYIFKRKQQVIVLHVIQFNVRYFCIYVYLYIKTELIIVEIFSLVVKHLELDIAPIDHIFSNRRIKLQRIYNSCIRAKNTIQIPPRDGL